MQRLDFQGSRLEAGRSVRKFHELKVAGKEEASGHTWVLKPMGHTSGLGVRDRGLG